VCVLRSINDSALGGEGQRRRRRHNAAGDFPVPDINKKSPGLSWMHIDKAVWNGLNAAQQAAILRGETCSLVK